MKELFYLLAIGPILWEIIVIGDPKRVHRFIQKLSSYGEHGAIMQPEAKDIMYYIFLITYVLWVFVGLFTSQWLLFLTLFIVGIIPVKYIFHRWLDGFISLCILLFTLLNAFHFHINVFQTIINLI